MISFFFFFFCSLCTLMYEYSGLVLSRRLSAITACHVVSEILVSFWPPTHPCPFRHRTNTLPSRTVHNWMEGKSFSSLFFGFCGPDTVLERDCENGEQGRAECCPLSVGRLPVCTDRCGGGYFKSNYFDVVPPPPPHHHPNPSPLAHPISSSRVKRR